MYGVPADLDLSRFVGARLINIGVGIFNTWFQFEADTLDYVGINALGRWEALTPDGQTIGGRALHGTEEYEQEMRVGALIGGQVDDAHVLDAHAIELRVTNGIALRFFDDSEQYESFTINGIGASDVIV